jgi:hypothetical protein
VREVTESEIVTYSRAGQLQPTGRPNNYLRISLRIEFVCTYIKRRCVGQIVMLKLRLNDKVVGRNKLGKKKRMIGSLCADLLFINIFSTNKVVTLSSTDVLYYVS